jgi:hypothetical protein
MRTAVPLVVGLFLLVLVACSSVSPVAIRAGDICENCRRPIQNVKVAAEIVPPGGLPLKFRTVSCAARYLHERQGTGDVVFVTDFPSGRLIRPQSAIFVKSEIDDNTKELDYYAFGNVPSALAFEKEHGGSATDWPSILQRVAASGAH